MLRHKGWKRELIVGMIGLSVWTAATAADSQEDGNSLLESCNVALRVIDENLEPSGDDSIRLGYCAGFLDGSRNTMMVVESLKGNQRTVCFPKGGITNGQTIRIVVKYLKDHPADLNQNKTLLTMLAYRDAYPCN